MSYLLTGPAFLGEHYGRDNLVNIVDNVGL